MSGDDRTDTERTPDTERPPDTGRTPAEWTTLVVSSIVLAVVIALIVVQLMSTTEPAAPRAEISTVEPVADRYRVTVAVVNDGDETAANVQVSAELASDTGSERGDLSIDFLAGGEEDRLVFLFDEDPSSGELTVAVTSYADP